MNTAVGTYIFIGWLIPRVVLADPHLVALLTQIQQLQDLHTSLQNLYGVK